MLENREEYKYLDDFYKSAFINKINIAIQEINIHEKDVSIYIVEKERDLVIITQGRGNINKPIKNDRINQIVLRNIELNRLVQLQKK